MSATRRITVQSDRTPVRELVAGARKWAHRLRASGDCGPHVAELLDRLADALEEREGSEPPLCRMCGKFAYISISLAYGSKPVGALGTFCSWDCVNAAEAALDAAWKETGR